jgi:hypothetical protein
MTANPFTFGRFKPQPSKLAAGFGQPELPRRHAIPTMPGREKELALIERRHRFKGALAVVLKELLKGPGGEGHHLALLRDVETSSPEINRV